MTPTQLTDESSRAFSAFKAYCADPKRSIRRCARKLRKSPTIIARWSKKHRWQKRLRELALEDCKRAVAADTEAKLNIAKERERLALRHAERKLQASERLFSKAHEVLRQSTKGTRPHDSAKMFVVAALLGDQALGVSGTNFGLRPTFQPVIRVTLHRDAMSDKMLRQQEEFFAKHPELVRPKNGLGLEDENGATGLTSD